MIEKSDFETFLYISKSKYQIFVYDKNNLKNLYNEEVERSDEIELNILSQFLDDNIYKIEKIFQKNPYFLCFLKLNELHFYLNPDLTYLP